MDKRELQALIQEINKLEQASHGKSWNEALKDITNKPVPISLLQKALKSESPSEAKETAEAFKQLIKENKEFKKSISDFVENNQIAWIKENAAIQHFMTTLVLDFEPPKGTTGKSKRR